MILYEPEVPSSSRWRRSLRQIDWTLLLLVSLALAFGLIALYSATASSEMAHFFRRQLLYAALGSGILLLVMWLPRSWLERLAPLGYIVGLLLLVAVLLFGRTVYGSKSWLSLGTLSFQPVEFAKLSTLLFVAHFLSREEQSLRRLPSLLITLALLGVPTALVLLQPDAGSALAFAALTLTVLFWGKAHPLLPLMPLLAGAVALLSLLGVAPLLLGILFSAILIFLTRPPLLIAITCSVVLSVLGLGTSTLYHMLKPHQQARIQSFLNPEEDPQGSGYHVIQSMLAIGSGGLMGKGFQQGTQTQLRFIPKQWTDFIFCVPAEEFGFLGAMLVLAVLFGLLWHVFLLAHRLEGDTFWSLLLGGIGGLWLFHTAINIGMSLGLAPVIGLPLPFMSAGGSALLVNMAMAGLVLNAHRQLYRGR
ncbi:MAG: rod shape-determining protein RodA [Candidatus Kapabacteria bacterium]|nr:rod shape-determining protein RodA [Candidatus Kapabacteria bacterium]MDW7996563.1 rod shape-determining protein RodA [Bacteroidota bacterium]